ncbi:hypothetical protein QTJ16_006420 [Diplocarpon rosae]|uniref:Uncharacterized protein n=1 Tax=Diplocarpon rosae TaxID=946125 RepID=A0AAD9SXF6_9HELO|nr:hypothetical protein QTJ16_006420 [Diplocarpon rosae]PBP28195.1 hypothetical protein BUE80_DR000860 [Diplocarpon rosae]
MPAITSTYLLPAILLNPAFVLHLINTFISHMMPPPPSISHSPHQFMESIGPLRNAAPCLDMHADYRLCWSYTAVMVVLQIFAFGKVSNNRVRGTSVKAAKLERERTRKERLEEEMKPTPPKENGHINKLDGAFDKPLVQNLTNGNRNCGITTAEKIADERKSDLESADSLTETSEEEMVP